VAAAAGVGAEVDAVGVEAADEAFVVDAEGVLVAVVVPEEGGGVAADGAEAVRVQQRQVVGAEAAHRDAADRDHVRVGPEALFHLRDHFPHHVSAPPAFPAVVPVAVVAAVGEGDDRRLAPQPRQAFEDGLVAGEGVIGAAAAVEEDEQRPLAPRFRLRRDDDADAELSTDRSSGRAGATST
jgi:hypothetical protein